MSDLKLAYETLRAKGPHHNKRWNYYAGLQPLKWTAKRMHDIFGMDQSDYVENWCGPIVDAVTNRLILDGFQVSDDEKSTARLKELFESTGLSLDADAVHQETDITGESYVIAWKDVDIIDCYHNDARNVHLFYDEERPRMKRFGCKWWEDAGEHMRLTLYYPHEIVYFRSLKKVSELGDFDAKGWNMEDIAENPFDQVPVFHFRLSANGHSELDNVLALQDFVNKTLSDLVVTSEFASFPQRWMITQSKFPDGGLPITPSEAWRLPPASDGEQPVSVGQFPAADLDNFLKSLDHTAQAMASITATPKHLFWGQSGTPSGEALMALEAPLVRKVQRYQNRISATWREVAAFLLLLDGTAVEKPTSILPVFADARTIQPLTESIVLQNDVGSGIPLINALRDRGWTQEDLDQLKKDEPAVPELFRPLPAEPTQ